MALALELLPTYRPLEAAPVLIDRRALELVSPDGRSRRRINGLALTLVLVLTEDAGAVVMNRAILDALWPADKDVNNPLSRVYDAVRELRDALVVAGWTREVVVTRNGVGWQIDMDEVARVMREARGE